MPKNKLKEAKDEDEAKKLVKPFVTFEVADATPLMLEKAGLTEEDVEPIRKTMTKGIFEAAKYVNEEMVELFSITGTPDKCIEKINEFTKAGINHLVFMSPLGSNIDETFQFLAEIR